MALVKRDMTMLVVAGCVWYSIAVSSAPTNPPLYSTSVAATQSTGSQPPSAQAAIDGKWVVSIGRVTKLLTLSIDSKNKKVTGTLADENGESADAIEGEYADGKLTFKLQVEVMRRDGSEVGRTMMMYEGRAQRDGSLAGTATLEGIEGAKNWSAVRPRK